MPGFMPVSCRVPSPGAGIRCHRIFSGGDGQSKGASEMADEALAGLDEGALRKLVSTPVGRFAGKGYPNTGAGPSRLTLHWQREPGTGPGLFRVADAQAPMACAVQVRCRCPVAPPIPLTLAPPV